MLSKFNNWHTSLAVSVFFFFTLQVRVDCLTFCSTLLRVLRHVEIIVPKKKKKTQLVESFMLSVSSDLFGMRKYYLRRQHK